MFAKLVPDNGQGAPQPHHARAWSTWMGDARYGQGLPGLVQRNLSSKWFLFGNACVTDRNRVKCCVLESFVLWGRKVGSRKRQVRRPGKYVAKFVHRFGAKSMCNFLMVVQVKITKNNFGPLLDVKISKKCIKVPTLWQAAHLQVKLWRTGGLESGHFWKLRCTKIEIRNGAKRAWKSNSQKKLTRTQRYATFFYCKNWKTARRYRAVHIYKSKPRRAEDRAKFLEAPIE